MSKKLFNIMNPPGERRLANSKKSGSRAQVVSRDILLHEHSPEELEERFGNVRLIKV